MSKVKVRFNLGKGKNYMKWKIQSSSGVEYHSACDVQLIITNGILRSNRKAAEKIFNGDEKNICAWVLCDSVKILHKYFTPYDKLGYIKIKYNPRKNPFWDINGCNVDNTQYSEIVSLDYSLFTKNLF